MTQLPESMPLGKVRQAALDCFAANGFHGTSIRQIASTAGLSVPGLYHYYTSKHQILDSLCEVAMDTLLGASKTAVTRPGTPVLERFDSLIRVLVLFHARFSAIAFVTLSEIRSLQGDARRRHVTARNEQQGLLNRLVEEGCKQGVFTTAHPRHTARAITAACLGVSRWFRLGGENTPEELAEIYVDICRATAGAKTT
ncbi:TetR/AcrR family transcriptional regulator [Nesterenkonia natronophila]|uniref:TetR/AcrR family transcriptional regulator n=1 Tax=Nesterenkonia natronophila TaxID=2174932 RepID=A0A3A4FJE6_9MICC|nr:TetR/AcrR family transcriptional regulator [Nesterenkonia natronophila]RJN32485.1 TetR/AcrR family transcriptional regulator [Nesterenkonia natronophila]